MSCEKPLSKHKMLTGRQTLKECCFTDEEGWWTSSAEIICACTWYQRHPTAAGPLVRERERGFHRWLDSNPARRAVSLINLSSAMRLCSHRCVSSFIQRQQSEKDHGSYAFHGCQQPGWRGSREHQWGGGVLCLLHAPHTSPPRWLPPTRSTRSYGSKRLPYLLVSSKTVNNIYFSGPIWQIVPLDVAQQ